MKPHTPTPPELPELTELARRLVQLCADGELDAEKMAVGLRELIARARSQQCKDP